MEDKLLKSLLKKAIGYNVSEISEEYNVDGDGNEVLSKRKVTKKYVPPDITALRAYLELSERDADYENMSDEKLMEIRDGLVKKLNESNKNKD
ncbi:MAG: hypothetical protein SPH07_05990 [Eubacteriales bacterium]|nr:hypothetical protein [Eubacteriales bacterium]MDY5439504.1 hypothetical protein [Eubacteriales bacterium]